MRWLALQHFAGQVIEHMTVAAAESLDETGQLWLVRRTALQDRLQGDGGQLQAGDPAFGALLQGGYLFHGQVQVHG